MNRGRIALAAAIAALAAAALLATTGCGGGGALSLDPVAAAASKTQNAGAARVHYAIGFERRGHSFKLDGNGVVDGTSADLTFDLGSLFRRMGLPAAALGGAAKAELAHASMEEILLQEGGDYVVYLRLPSFLSSHLPGGKPWMKLDLSKVGSVNGINFNQLMSGGEMSPTDLLGMLRGEGAKVTTVGPATIDGVATTHYAVKVDVAKVLQSKGLTSPMLSRLTDKLPTVPEDVWIGKDGLVRRISLTLAINRTSMQMRMDMSDYGVNATIAAPPSDSVFDMTSLVAKQTH